MCMAVGGLVLCRTYVTLWELSLKPDRDVCSGVVATLNNGTDDHIVTCYLKHIKIGEVHKMRKTDTLNIYISRSILAWYYNSHSVYMSMYLNQFNMKSSQNFDIPKLYVSIENVVVILFQSRYYLTNSVIAIR